MSKFSMFLKLAIVLTLLVSCSQTRRDSEAPKDSNKPTETQSTRPLTPTLTEIQATDSPSPEEPTSNPWQGLPWQELPFDQFLDQSWFAVMQRDPELLTELGLSEAFGLRDDQLTNISAAYVHETYSLYAEILNTLYSYDRDSLPEDQQLNYDIYAWYLEDTLQGQDYLLYNYPVTHFITGVQNQLINFFTDIHPITNKQNAEDYITRLSQVDEKFEQLIANMELSEQAGIITPRFILEWSLRDIRAIGSSVPKLTPFYGNFSRKVNDLDTLSADEKNTLLKAAEEEIDASVIPAFANLADYLEDLIQRAPTDDGVWQFPDGNAYYEYLVRHFTTTNLTPDEIHQLGLDELARIQGEMRQIFTQLEYPEDENLPELYNRVAKDGGILYGEDIVTGYETIIANAKIRSSEVLDLQPKSDVIVIPGPTGGYYIGPSLDGSRPGAFYAAVNGSEPKFGMASLAYHEAIPGHHTQVALALEMDLPAFRRGSHFTAYVEGWALYAERLMFEIGAYENDPYGDLGRLQYEAFRAARLVVDTGIHTKGWTFDQAVEFMIANTGMTRQEVEFEISRYIAWPGQALAYKIGMNEILRLRDKAEDALGDQFDIRQFHNTVLGNSAVPLTILEDIVDDYISSTTKP